MPKIYLARHGQDEDNANGILNGHRNTPLTAIGVEQAQTLAQNIKEHDLQIRQVFSSPLIRANTTAETVSNALGIKKPQALDLLIERDFGVMTGKCTKDIESLCAPDIIKSDPIVYFLSPEGAETFPQLIERAKGLLDWLERQDFTDDILLVSHGDIGKMIYAAYYRLEWQEVLTQFHFGNSEVLLLSKESTPEERHIMKVQQHNH